MTSQSPTSSPITVKLVLPIERPLITPNTTRGVHWTKIKEARDATALLMKQALRKAKVTTIETPVHITMMWYAPDRHTRDPESLAAQAKLCVDSLVKEKVIPDDNSVQVYQVALGPVIVARDNPRLELWIRTVDGTGCVPGGGPGTVVP